jgi:indole-3-glycerol phosphate synthase
MAAVLDQIVAATRARVAEAKRTADLAALTRRAEQHVPRGFRRALENPHVSQNPGGPSTPLRASMGHPALENAHPVAKGATRMGQPRDWTAPQDRIAVIAELKKASPSKGLIRAEFHPVELARELEMAGAVALSVLTDEEFFQGSLGNLCAASAAVKIPCLRKDFIVDEFQILEARANSADAILLIVAALTEQALVALARSARAQGLDVLCEVHDEDELQRALDAGCDLIGVNSRDLRTFQVDLDTAVRMAEKFPANVVRVAESGIHSSQDVARLREAGYHAFLVGESLMRAERPGEALRELMRVPSRESGVASMR